MPIDTADHLYNTLLDRLHQTPPASLAKLEELHSRYPELHSVHSYNLLLEHALRHHHRAVVVRVSHQFRHSHLAPDWKTLRLWVRFYVQEGRLQQAWDTLLQDNSVDVATIPLDVWKEFLGSSRAFSLKRRRRAGSSLPLSQEPSDVVPNLVSRQIESSFRLKPALTSVLCFFRAAVARLVQAGRLPIAVAIVKKLLHGAPLKLSHSQEHILLSVVHQLLAYAPIGTQSHLHLREVLDSLLEVRPSLRYNAATLHGLLRTLSRTRHVSWQALKLLRAWLRKWGRHIERPRVQLRIAVFALREGRADIAKLMTQRLLEDIRRQHHVGGTRKPEPRSPGQRRMSRVYRRRGRQNVVRRLSILPKLNAALQKMQPSRLTACDRRVRRFHRMLQNSETEFLRTRMHTTRVAVQNDLI